VIIATNARPPTPLWSLGTCPAPGGTALAGEYESPAIPDLGALVEVVHEMRVMALSGIHGEGGGASVGRQM
jgi:hypothetical protein